MLRRLVSYLARVLLGPAARAGRPVLDNDARLAIPARALENAEEMQLESGTTGGPRRVRHLTVYEGGARKGRVRRDGPFGRPTPVSPDGRRVSGGRG